MLKRSTSEGPAETRDLKPTNDLLQLPLTYKDVWAEGYTVWLTVPHWSFHNVAGVQDRVKGQGDEWDQDYDVKSQRIK